MINIITHNSNNVVPELTIFQTDLVEVINPKFTMKNGGITTHEVYGNGNWSNNDDHSLNFILRWDPQHIHLEVIIKDDIHHVHGQSDWAGDCVQIIFTDKDKKNILFEMSTSYYGQNAEYNLDSLSHHLIRWSKNRYYKNGTVLLIQKSQSDSNDSLINFIDIIRDENKKETTYKITIPYKYIQNGTFKNEQSLGFSLMVNDGDYIDNESDDGIEIIHFENTNNNLNIIKNIPLLEKLPLSISLKVKSNTQTYLVYKKGNLEINVNNNNLYLNNNLIFNNIALFFLLVLNLSNTKSNIFYCPINNQLNKVTQILNFDSSNIIQNNQIESNTNDIILGKEILICKISNRIMLDGNTESSNTQNDIPNNVVGQRGWSGWFPTALVYPQDPKYAGLLHFQYGRTYNHFFNANILIRKTNKNQSDFKIIFDKNDLKMMIMYQLYSESFPEFNINRQIKQINLEEWVKTNFQSNVLTYKPTTIMHIDDVRQIIFILNLATINKSGKVIFYISSKNMIFNFNEDNQLILEKLINKKFNNITFYIS